MCVGVCVGVGVGGWVRTSMHGCIHVDVHDSECSGVVSEFLARSKQHLLQHPTDHKF